MSDARSAPRIDWPSGDCIPLIATKLSPDELSQRTGLSCFREQDDLDWFVGILGASSEIGSVLVMKHDNNPEDLTVFYVDAAVEVRLARQVISAMFLLEDCDVFWTRPSCARS